MSKDSREVGPKLHVWETLRSKSLIAATDAGLFQLAWERKDGGLQLEACKRHLRAISLLRAQLSDPKANKMDTLGNTLGMLLFEAYSGCSRGLSQRTEHISGVVALLLKDGLAMIETPFGPFTFRLARMCSVSLLQKPSGCCRKLVLMYKQLMHGLVNRQHLSLAGKLSQPSVVPARHMDQLIQHTLRLPGVLEITDGLVSKSPSAAERASVIGQLQNLELCIMGAWLSEPPTTGPAYSHVEPVSFEPAYPDLSTTPLVFHRALRFDSFLSAVSHTFYWSCLLLIRLALYNIAVHLPSSQCNSASADSRNSAASEVVDLLCQGMPFLLHEAGGLASQAIAVRAPLYFVRYYCEQTQDRDRLAWHDDVERHVRERAAFLEWDALLPWGFFSMNWLAP